MPYSAPTNLVQAAFDAYNAPINSTILQEDAVLKRQEIMANQMQLQNQMGLQQDLKSIWGAGGMATAEASFGDPSQSPKLMATAAALAAHGNPQAATSLLGSLSLMGYRQVEAQKYRQQTQWRNLQEVGSALGNVTDQGSEDAALALARAQGIDPAQYGLTGDYVADAGKIPVIAQSALTRAQQMQAQDRETVHADLQAQRDFSNGIASQRMTNEQRRIDIQQAMADLRTNHTKFLEGEADKKDARAQEGLHLKELQMEDRSISNASKLQKPEADAAVGMFMSDQRTSELPPPLQKSLALLAARRAKQEIYKQMMESGDAEYEPGDFEQELALQMDRMQRQGMFQSGDNYTFKPSPAGAPVHVTSPTQGTQGTKPTTIYRTPADVATAYREGKITRDEATKLLKGM